MDARLRQKSNDQFADPPGRCLMMIPLHHDDAIEYCASFSAGPVEYDNHSDVCVTASIAPHPFSLLIPRGTLSYAA